MYLQVKRINNEFIISLWYASIFWCTQYFHTWAYARGDSVDAFPAWQMPTLWAFIASVPLWMLAFLAMRLMINKCKQRPIFVLIIVLPITELASQFCSRSVLRACIELLMAFIVWVRLRIDSEYGTKIDSDMSASALKLIHSELLVLLRLCTSFSIFIAGVLGVSFSAHFLQKYYGSPTLLPTLLWYVAGILYLFLAVVFLVFSRLFSLVTSARERLIRMGEGTRS